jgi:large subunit ribosomal protein L9
MNVILMENVHNLGDLGQSVNVKAGYGRNFLIPKGMAVPATSANVAKFEAKRVELEKAETERLAQSTSRKDSFVNLASVTISHKVGEEGKLFGSVGTAEIAAAICEKGVQVIKREIRLPDGAIRMVGEYDIDIDLQSEVVATVKINIIPE